MLNSRLREVTVFEVGPRDGLQNESRKVSTNLKLRLVKDLLAAGVQEIEAGSFVRKDRVPQMAGTDLIFRKLGGLRKRFNPWALIPNIQGLTRALEVGVRRVAFFTATSETFSKKNTGMSVADSLDCIRGLAEVARREGLETRAYVSTVFGCPYEGVQRASHAVKIVETLLKYGIEQISIGDTIGVAVPTQIEAVVRPTLLNAGVEGTAVHFHDTRGTALANVLRSLDLGVRIVDSSVGGLGGCPFAPGATGNLATEDLVYMLERMGLSTGIDLDELCRVSSGFSRKIGRPISSRYLKAWSKNRKS